LRFEGAESGVKMALASPDPFDSSAKKAYLVKKIKIDVLPRLKRGELVAFEV